MTKQLPCKLAVLSLLFLAKHGNERPYSDDELVEKLAIPRRRTKEYLWRWEHRVGIIKKEESHDGSSLYHLTKVGEGLLALVNRIPVRKLK